MSTEQEHPNAAKARELADGLRRYAEVVEANPDLYGDLVPSTRQLSYIPGGPNVRERMLAVINACVAAGARAVERTNDARWAAVDLFFGPVTLYVYTDRSWLGDAPAPPVEVPAYAPLLGGGSGA